MNRLRAEGTILDTHQAVNLSPNQGWDFTCLELRIVRLVVLDFSHSSGSVILREVNRYSGHGVAAESLLVPISKGNENHPLASG